jgi:hypothetical protein
MLALDWPAARRSYAKLVDQPWKIMSIGPRDVFQQGADLYCRSFYLMVHHKG